MANYVFVRQFLFHFSELACLPQRRVACAWLGPICSFLERNTTYISKKFPYPTVQKRRSGGHGCAIPALRPEVRC